MRLYKASKYSNKIEEVEYTRTTDKFAVRSNGRRDALETEHDTLRRTREEAVQWKMDRLEGALRGAEINVVHRRKDLEEFEAYLAMTDYSCGAAFCDDPACVTHNPKHPRHDV